MNSLQSFYTKKRVLVTGGAGFIGSHLVEKLVSLGAHVTVMDNFASGNLSNLKSVVGSINLLYADVRSPYSCLKATTTQDIVFHLAAFISVPESIMFPEVCKSVNTTGTANMLEAARRNNVKTFILSSSSAVYGSKEGSCSEADALDPLTPYAESKCEAEALCKEFAIKHNLNVASLRYFNVYGQRQNAHGTYAAVIAKFKDQLLKNEPLTIYGDGSQTRDFVEIEKITQANLLIGSASELNGDVFNVGSGQSLSLLKLVNKLEHELSVNNKGLVFQPARQDDITHAQADCTKLATFLRTHQPASDLT
jgi:UDP-glucose 4-epimerase